MLFLIVTIGMLNVCLGFGLAMYYGYGPPGMDGIFQSLGPMPSANPDAAPRTAGKLGAMYVPVDTAAETVPQASPNPTADAAHVPPADPLSEEEVLNDVRAMTAAAQAMLASGEVRAQE